MKKQSVSGSVSTVWLTRGFLESFTYHKPTVVNARCKTTATDTFCEIASWRKSHHDKGNTDEFPFLWRSHTPIPSNTATVYNIHRLQRLVAEVWQKLWNSDLCLKILSCSVPLLLPSYIKPSMDILVKLSVKFLFCLTKTEIILIIEKR